MSTNFGPWSTALSDTSTPQLSTFWKRRLAMLPVLRRNHALPTRRALLALAVLAAGACAIPTFWNAPLLAQPAAEPAAENASDNVTETKLGVVPSTPAVAQPTAATEPPLAPTAVLLTPAAVNPH